jgi:hypothetical protein
VDLPRSRGEVRIDDQHDGRVSRSLDHSNDVHGIRTRPCKSHCDPQLLIFAEMARDLDLTAKLDGVSAIEPKAPPSITRSCAYAAMVRYRQLLFNITQKDILRV